MTDTGYTTPIAQSFAAKADMLDKLYAGMPAPIRSKIAVQFVIALDSGADLYDPRTLKSPAGEIVIAWANREAARLGFSDEARMVLRHDVRAVGRQLIKEALAAI